MFTLKTNESNRKFSKVELEGGNQTAKDSLNEKGPGLTLSLS